MRWAGPGLLTALWPTSATVLREASTLAGATCLLLRCRPGGAFVSHPAVSVSRLAAVRALCGASRALLYTFDHAYSSADRSRGRFHAGRRRRRSGASQRLLRMDGDHHGSIGADGVGFMVFLDTIFPPIPSEIVLPLAGFTSSQGQMSIA